MARIQQRPYRSYLLRLWQTYGDGHEQWHASLESAQTGELTICADLLELVEYLAQQTQTADKQHEREVINRLFEN